MCKKEQENPTIVIKSIKVAMNLTQNFRGKSLTPGHKLQPQQLLATKRISDH